MCKLLFAMCTLALVSNSYSQNVGIGTESPATTLDVNSTKNFVARFNGPNGMYIGLFEANVLRGYLGSFSGGPTDVDFGTGESNTDGRINFTIRANPKMTIDPAGNVGIGTLVPTTRFEVNSTAQFTAKFTGGNGMYIGLFEGTAFRGYLGSLSGATEDFDIGTPTNNTNGKLHFTIETSPKMTVDNAGNVGIGTTDPTAKLDVNGNFRLRGSFPKVGSILTSADASGNAQWSDPIAFKSSGLFNNANVTILPEVWTQVLFSSTPSYNLGFGFSPSSSQFNAPEKGIYHFDTNLKFQDIHYLHLFAVRLRLNRNGAISTIGEFNRPRAYSEKGDDDTIKLPGLGGVSTDVALLAGDVVWVEVYIDSPVSFDGPISSATMLAHPVFSWFNGHLVTRY